MIRGRLGHKGVSYLIMTFHRDGTLALDKDNSWNLKLVVPFKEVNIHFKDMEKDLHIKFI
jgi:hypothetical protein